MCLPGVTVPGDPGVILAPDPVPEKPINTTFQKYFK